MVTWRCRIDEQSYQVARCIAKHWGIPLSKAIGRMLHEYAADLSAQVMDEALSLRHKAIGELTPDEVEALVQRLEQGLQSPIGPKVMRSG